VRGRTAEGRDTQPKEQDQQCAQLTRTSLRGAGITLLVRHVQVAVGHVRTIRDQTFPSSLASPLIDQGQRPGALRPLAMSAELDDGPYGIRELDMLMEAANRSAEVLIVGAGPTGLVLALWLKRLGIDVRIIDRAAEPRTTSRALVVQARTLELYRQLGLSDEVVERGREFAAVNVWVRGKPGGRVALGDIGRGLSPFGNEHLIDAKADPRDLQRYLEARGIRTASREFAPRVREGATTW
jgi:hypothetical protein